MNKIGDLEVLGTVKDGIGATSLAYPLEIASTVIGGKTFVYVASYNDDAIQVLTVDKNGNLNADGVFTKSSAVNIDGVRGLDIAEVGNKKFLVVTGEVSDAITLLEIDQTGSDRGSLSFSDDVKWSAADPLDYPRQVEVFETSQGTFAAVTAWNSDSLSIYKIRPNGTFLRTDFILDSESLAHNIDAPWDLAIHKIGSKTFAFVLGYNDDSISVFEISAAGKLKFKTAVQVQNAYLEGIEAVRVDGQDLLFVTDAYSDDIISYKVNKNGVPSELSRIDLYATVGMSNPLKPEFVEIAGVPFLVVGDNSADVVAVFSVNGKGEVQLAESMQDYTLFDGAVNTETIWVDGRQLILVASSNNSSVTVLEVGGGEDAIIGTQNDDRIVGLDGDDDLIGKKGDDLLKGGAGDDVLNGKADNDTLRGDQGKDVLVGGNGNDLLEGGAQADVMVGGNGFDILSYIGSNEAVTVNLANGLAKGGHAAGDIFTEMEGVEGSRYNDKIIGDNAANRLYGRDGNDNIRGNGGNDTINGDAGNDVLDGDDGNDKMRGGHGNDTVRGDAGNDTMFGDAGKDKLEGGAGNDKMNGGAGDDILNGGVGNDRYTGGGGSDTFVFARNDGTDQVTDFAVNVDKIDFSGHATYNSFADVKADWFSFGSNTVIVDGTSSIELTGVKLAQLDAGDFLF